MKKNRIFGLALSMLLLGVGACSNDMIVQDQNQTDAETPADGVYLAVNFDLPAAKETRSFTSGADASNNGTENGRDYENKVSEAYIVLAKTDNSFIAAAKSTTLDAVGTTGRSYRNTAIFNKTDLNEFYMSTITDADKDERGNYKVNVYVFANPNEGLTDLLENASFGDTDWINAKGVYNEPSAIGTGIIWGKDKFLMSNSSVCTRLFPGTLAAWDEHTTAATAFNLSGMNNFGRPNEIDNLMNGDGNIPIERAAARYDFRDGALDGVGNNDPELNGFKAQTYHVVLDTEEKPLVDVFLGKMSMVNMNKEYYFLRRVSNDGMPQQQGVDNGYKFLGQELPWYIDAFGNPIEGQKGNYVIDALADWKFTTPNAGFASKLNFPFFNEVDGEVKVDNLDVDNDRWYTSVISKVLADGESDQWNLPEATEENPNPEGKYKTWRYLTEGTIPGPAEKQQNGISNGIVFKGLLQPARAAIDGDDQFTKKLLESLQVSEDGNKLHDPILYVFQNHIYCTWDHIRRMAVYLALTDLKWDAEQNKWTFGINRSSTLYNAVFGTGGFGSVKFSCERVASATLENANFLEDGDDAEHQQVLTDGLAADPDAANTKYIEWKDAYPGSDDEVTEDESAELVYFDAFRKAAVDKLIALYQTSYDKALGGWGYYCYYYYWNRHNDNGQVGIMGPMEFAVVRNNVYKLAVTKISRLGHPRVSANDPDKPTPNTPDEKGDVYISVTCSALPWVVRENTIKF